MSAAVLSLIVIISVATCCTVTVVAAGSFRRSPEGRLLTASVTVSFWVQLTFPVEIAWARASDTYSLNAEPSGAAVVASSP